MTEFKAGDKVRVISSHTLNGVGYGEVEVGDIVTVVGESGLWDVPTYHVRRADGGMSVIDATCLELRYTFDPGGEKIAFEGVRVGDTIAALTYSQWRVAEVDEVSDNFLGDAVGDCIAYDDSDTEEIRLLHRPEPKVDPAKVAAVAEVINQVDVSVQTANAIALALVKAGIASWEPV